MKKLSAPVIALFVCVPHMPHSRQRISEADPSGYSGECGEDAVYEFNPATGELTIGGSGAVYDFTEHSMPWNPYKGSIKTVRITGPVTYIGKHAFSGCTALECISVSDSVTGVGDSAFDGRVYDADGQTELAQTAENLAGSVFWNADGKWIKQVPAPSGNTEDSGSGAIYLIVAIVALAALSAAVMMIRKKSAR